MRRLIAALLLAFCTSAGAHDLYMVRSQLAFPETMALLQQAIKDEGYQVSRVQRVDIGLTKSGFKTDKYRVVFFGRLEDMREVISKYPELIPYMPMKIAIFAEGDETLALCSGFDHLRSFYKSPDLRAKFDRWEADMRKILENVRNAQ